jgi:hypothetical protein
VPPPCWIMLGRTARVHRNVPKRLVVTPWYQSLGSVSHTVSNAAKLPAQFTNKLTLPASLKTVHLSDADSAETPHAPPI